MSAPKTPYGPDPWQQRHWDGRAAANFACGGLGAGLVASAALAGDAPLAMALGAVFVAAGLVAVWFEIGRPGRALNVLRNPRSSWMAREALVAPLLLACALAPALGFVHTAWLAAALALAFVYAQARILQAARGIPAWRAPRVVPLVVASGLAEGTGVLLVVLAFTGSAPLRVWGAAAVVLFARLVAWEAWRRSIDRAPPRALAAIDAAGLVFKATTLVALVAAVVAVGAPLPDGIARVVQAAAGLAAAAGGVWFKWTLVLRGAYNQGFALQHLPVRGQPRPSAAR